MTITTPSPTASTSNIIDATSALKAKAEGLLFELRQHMGKIPAAIDAEITTHMSGERQEVEKKMMEAVFWLEREIKMLA